MKRRTWAWAIAFLVVTTGAAHAANVTIITGSEKGTYYQFGLDLQALGKQHGLEVNVVPSKGSIENLLAVYERPATQLGIVQADVLAFVSRVPSDPALRRIASKTKMVFPLYNEEVHILARRGIRDFDDLADRRVAIGRDGSGTYLTARLLFNVTAVAPKEMVRIDTDEALRELKAGRIDAMFYVAGLPVKLLRDLVTPEDDLVLLPVANEKALAFYPRSEIPAGVYPWQESPVHTVAVKSVLVSFDFRYRDCETVGSVGKMIADNIEYLASNGHSKWKAVDLNYRLKGWEQYDCVRKRLARQPSAAPRPEDNPVLRAMKRVLGE